MGVIGNKVTPPILKSTGYAQHTTLPDIPFFENFILLGCRKLIKDT